MSTYAAESGSKPDKTDPSDPEKGVDNRSRTSIQSSPLGTSEEVNINDVLGLEETNPVTRDKMRLVNDVSQDETLNRACFLVDADSLPPAHRPSTRSAGRPSTPSSSA